MRKTTGDALVGTEVAHYVVEARLGGGGMGVVYAARDTKLGRRVALKFLPPQWSHDESAKQRFIREAQAASATDHPNICTIHDIGTAADGQLFIVMAYYEGETLKARLERGRLPLDEAMDIAAQVAEGLAKAHSQGVVHRDIKPGNLMLTEDGVKILDFGLAKFADTRLKLTLEGSTIGTIAYMSPEQARGEEADARSDVWAVGVVLYEMLTGGVPFKGGYPEAIAHAIRNDPPAPIRPVVPEVPEALEQLVFRALYKERAVRIQSARDLARSLRLLQGRTLPLDLRTEALPQVDTLRATSPARAGRWRSRKAAVAAAIMLVLTAGVPAWMFWPVQRIPVAVAPVVNQTGYAELDAYRLALTRELIAQLSESRVIRVLPHERLLQITGQFRTSGGDISGRQAMQLLAEHSGAAAIVVPTLVNEGSGWRARVDIRNPQTATTGASLETAPVLSSLPKEAVYDLMPALAQGLQQHFTSTAPWRASMAQRLRALGGVAAAPAGVTFRTLDAADAFERGQQAFEHQEYAAALAAFTTANERDPRSPLALAWRSRTARLMRRDQEALDHAEAAAGLLRPETPRRDRMLVEATAAEARGQAQIAEARYSALVDIDPGDTSALGQLAGFFERQGRADDAIALHHRALAVDSRAIRPHLDLCRLYNPRELAAARQQGGLALDGYRAVGDRGGEAQTLFCLVDALRLGTAEERQQARVHAKAALDITERLDYPYTRARAHHYVALAAFAAGDLPAAAAAWEQAASGAHVVGNAVLEPLALMNLGAVQGRLGQPSRQLELLQRSAALFEALGQHLRVAELEANVAALLIEYAGQPDEGMRRLQNALQVARKLGSTNFEAFATQVMGAYHRFAGRHAEAERQLNLALALARERDLADRIPSMTVDLAWSRFDAGQYESARTLLVQALDTGRAEPTTRILLAQTNMRLGDFSAARQQLDAAARELHAGGDPEDLPLLHTAEGQLAYESGRMAEARASFEQSSALWTDALPHAATVEARAYLGLFDAMSGRVAGGQAAIRKSIEQAQQLGRLSLQTVCRILLARTEIAARNYSAALATLDAIPADDDTRTVGTELRAHSLYWRSRALAGLGNPSAAADADRARRMIDELREQVPDTLRADFARRPDIRLIAEGPVFEPKGSLR